LKGSAATIGFTAMAELTHAMETALDALRRGRRRMDRGLADALLDALDHLRRLIEDDGEPVDDVVERLRRSIEAPEQPPTARRGAAKGKRAARPATGRGATSPPDRGASAETAPSSPLASRILRITVRPTPGPWSGVRAVQALLALEALGTIVTTRPERSAIESGDAVEALDVWLATASEPSEINLALEAVPELEEVGIDDTTPSDHPLAEAHASADADAHGDSPSDPAGDDGRDGERPPTPTEAAAATEGAAPSASLPRPGDDRGGTPLDGSKAAPPSASERGGASRTVRIDVSRLDALMTLVGELVVARNRLIELTGKIDGDLRTTMLAEELEEATQHLGRVTDQLQEEVMKSRLLPIRLIFQRLPRLVRDLSSQLDKDVTLQLSGEETELDRTVIEEVADPVLHIVRNAIDHGIEPPEERQRLGKPRSGTLQIAAAQREGWVVVTIEDDGRGIDAERVRERSVQMGLITAEQAARLDEYEALQLIFLPGLSTATKVSDISGRGVGMDVVRNNVERLNGSVAVETWPGRGTRFTLRFPLTLAITRALLVTVGTTVYAIPLSSVNEAFRIDATEIQQLVHTEAVVLRGAVLPLLRLRGLFGEEASASTDQTLVVAVRSGSQDIGLVVDRLLGTQELVVKPLPPVVRRLPALVGSATLGDGRIALILDPGHLNSRTPVVQGERYERSPVAVS
ncbi:MAG TPA: chemotaxis protein CheA, partial [Chloroflexota bacterium]